MKSYNSAQFKSRLTKLWFSLSSSEAPNSIAQQIQFFTGGEIFREDNGLDNDTKEPFFSLFAGIIHNPTHQITNAQLCQIFDEGNHCLSVGHISYENNYCFYQWSNAGHL